MREGYVPVWLEPQLMDGFYNGFCNSVRPPFLVPLTPCCRIRCRIPP
jgi:hypothetical protein